MPPRRLRSALAVGVTRASVGNLSEDIAPSKNPAVLNRPDGESGESGVEACRTKVAGRSGHRSDEKPPSMLAAEAEAYSAGGAPDCHRGVRAVVAGAAEATAGDGALAGAELKKLMDDPSRDRRALADWAARVTRPNAAGAFVAEGVAAADAGAGTAADAGVAAGGSAFLWRGVRGEAVAADVASLIKECCRSQLPWNADPGHAWYESKTSSSVMARPVSKLMIMDGSQLSSCSSASAPLLPKLPFPSRVERGVVAAGRRLCSHLRASFCKAITAIT